MVRGDPRLRRPYLVEVSSSSPAAAHDLAAYVRSPDAQQWIATFKRGAFDDQPLFFAVSVPSRRGAAVALWWRMILRDRDATKLEAER